MIDVFYAYRSDGPELVERREQVGGYAGACHILDAYPWHKELVQAGRFGEGGGLLFHRTGSGGETLSLQVVPDGPDLGVLDLHIELRKTGLAALLGRSSLHRTYEITDLAAVKELIREFCEYSPEQLFQRYRLAG